ncbi:unnamed protein product [Linum trigynum]|uniref:Reverse transcriptase domain-containing protein n=1 Tax=Linum trigynum TaxID=586398 RepID=A0AAV2GHA7_9ROSI
MGALKAPGKDGLNPFFYQRCWNIVGSAVVDFGQAVWHQPSRIKEVNSTISVLIPKIAKPILIEQFRPISLCNVSYKMVTKCLAERPKPLMPSLVHETQTSFVPGRQITDNIFILQEVPFDARKVRQGGLMVLKIDLAKAYDRIK